MEFVRARSLPDGREASRRSLISSCSQLKGGPIPLAYTSVAPCLVGALLTPRAHRAQRSGHDQDLMERHLP